MQSPHEKALKAIHAKAGKKVKRYTGEYMAGSDGKTRSHDSGIKTVKIHLGDRSADSVLRRK